MIIEMKFELPEEQESFDICLNANKYKMLLDDTERYIRNELKYKELSDKERAGIEKFKKFYYQSKTEIFDGNF